jgi:hypothetical protein
MRSFKEHLAESKKTYSFRVKVAGTVSDDQEKAMESLLSKFEISSFKKTGKTPIQELPLDFPAVKNSEVSIYEVTLNYPTTQFELVEYLSSELGITKQCIVVRRPDEPYEAYQQKVEKQQSPLLMDSEYKEAPAVNGEDYYGDKYNTGFVKELNSILKLQRRERGEEIPEGNGTGDSAAAAKAKFNTDATGNTKSPVMQAADPRK